MLEELFSIRNRVIVLTGAGGVLVGTMAKAIAQCGAKVAILDICKEAAQKVNDEIQQNGGDSLAVTADVLDKSSLEQACEKIIERYGKIDGLVNGAGGNKKEATTSENLSFFDLDPEANKWVFSLNFEGTLLPCQVFGKELVKQETAAIVNISSTSAFRPMDRAAVYAAAKAATINFTYWLAVHMCKYYSTKIRVNSIAPGTCISKQNEYLLFNKDKTLTERGKAIINMVPQKRFGNPEELIGAAIWLLSDSASFATGSVIRIDGGLEAYNGI